MTISVSASIKIAIAREQYNALYSVIYRLSREFLSAAVVNMLVCEKYLEPMRYQIKRGTDSSRGREQAARLA